VPRVEFSLTLAATSNLTIPEKRLSAILGTVLEGHVGFANVLLAKLGLSPIREPVVWREEQLGRAGAIDLILRGTGQEGHSSVVYFENKDIRRPQWQPGQPHKYLDSLRDEIEAGATGRLLVVVGNPKDVRDRVRRRVGDEASEAEAMATLRAASSDERMVFATWHDVAGWAFEAGEQSSSVGRDWLSQAAQPGSRADQRLLAELIWYLEEEGYAMAKGLTTNQIDLAREAFTLSELLTTVEEDVGTRLRNSSLQLRKVQGKPTEFRMPIGSWLEEGARLYVYFQPPESRPELDLAFYLDVYVGVAERALRANAGWQHKLAKEGFEFDGESIVDRFDARKLLTYSTASAQGEALTRWLIGRVSRLLELSPGR